MPYLIDGHNLIPKVQGLSLEDFDDEARLIEMMQEFCRLQRKEAEVFFDNAPAGGMRVRTLGLVTARFARSGTTADEAIRKRLTSLGRVARNWTVVSSDLAVQTSARAAQARILSSEAFAAILQATLHQQPQNPSKTSDAPLSDGEIDEWLDLFGGK
jgi:predicted RNA-binding protein with PIN domain